MRPPHDAYWVVEHKLLAGHYAGAKNGLPAERRLGDLLDAGVTCFVDLTEEGEQQFHGAVEPYEAVLRALAARRGSAVTYHRFAIRDVDVAPIEVMRDIQATIADALAAGQVVYVHCWGGVGRTGMAVGCYLASQPGTTGSEALLRIKDLRAGTQRAHRPSPETEAQCRLVRDWC